MKKTTWKRVTALALTAVLAATCVFAGKTHKAYADDAYTFPLAELKISPDEIKKGFGFSLLLHEDDGQGPDGVMTFPPATVHF